MNNLTPYLKVVAYATLAVAVLVTSFLLVSWVASAPREGTVEAAWVQPAHWERYQSSSICASYDEKGYCSFSVPVYSERWVPDQCYVKLNDVDKHREWTWTVGCAELASYKVGQHGAVK